jgi:DHA3 family macrolide efflux protein-like MFS transporter
MRIRDGESRDGRNVREDTNALPWRFIMDYKDLDSEEREKDQESLENDRTEGGGPEGSGDSRDWVKKTVIFLSGQAVSLFGSSLVQYAIVWYIVLTTKSGYLITLSTLFGFLPQLVISIFAGVWADRYSRKKLIIYADILIATSTLALAILFFMGYRELWLIFAVSFIRSIGAGIQTPAVGALLPQIVPQDKLMRVNGINASLQSTMMIISPAVSGMLLTYSTLEVIFLIDVVTASIAITLLLLLKVPVHKKALEKSEEGYFDDLKIGVRYAAGNRFIRSLIIFFTLFTFFVAPIAMLTPLLVARSYGEEVWRLTLNEIAFFAGMILGGFFIGIWEGMKNRINTVAVTCLLFGVLTLFMGVTRSFPVYLGLMFVIGLILPYFNTPVTTLLQENVPEEKLGRVFSLLSAANISMPLGMIIFGPLAEVISVELILIITGVLMFLQGISIFYNRGLKDYETQVF